MPELERETVFEITSPNSSLPVSPHILSPISSEVSISLGSEIDVEYGGSNFDLYLPFQYSYFQLPLEPTLRELLIRATSTNELTSVTKLQLQVTVFEVSLQHIPSYIPCLKELILDGSLIITLRDLGTGLKHLKVLSVARCGLTHLDGMFGLETLEEFYAQDNRIRDLSPCGFLPSIRVLNLKGNILTDILTVSFLSVCNGLDHLVLEGNRNLCELSRYRRIIKSILPNLKTLDDVDITTEEIIIEYAKYSDIFNPSPPLEDPTLQEVEPCTRLESVSIDSHPPSVVNATLGQFVVSFPPKVLSSKPTSRSSSDTSIYSSYVLEDTYKKWLIK